MNVEQRLEKLYNEMIYDEDYCNVYTVEDAKRFMNNDWGKGGYRGYAIFDDDHYTPRGMVLECINRIDEYEIYSGDIAAARQAEKDGFCKLIHDIKIPKDMDEIYYVSKTAIDNPHNRDILNQLLNEYKELTRKRYAYYIYRKSDGECMCESELTPEDMPVKKSDAMKLAKKELETLCKVFNVNPDYFEIEIEGGHVIGY